MLAVSSGFYIGSLFISYYGLIMALGMALGVFVACLTCKKRGFKSNDILILACYVLPLSIIGARLYYVLFSLEKFTSFWQIFEVWKGGMAIYGGVIGGAIGVGLYCLIHKKNFFSVADIAAPSLILGQAIGRIGCFFAGCCYGIEVTNPSQMWFPLSVQINGVWHYSTFFYESFWNFLVFAALMLLLYFGKFIKERGVIVSGYFILYGIGRAWIEGLRGDSLYIGAIKVSQLLSILLILLGIAILLAIYIPKYALKKPLAMFEGLGCSSKPERCTLNSTETKTQNDSNKISSSENDQNIVEPNDDNLDEKHKK